MIAVHRGRGGVRRNPDGWNLRIIGRQETHSLPVHADAAWDQVGVEGESIALAVFDPRDLAAPFHLSEHVLQFSLLAPRQRQL
jgi:hypothetical protein